MPDTKTDGAPTTALSQREDLLYRKVAWRLLPFMMVCYVAAFVDRVNIGFAKLQMLHDLHFSEAIYGLGAGLFFIGYFIFEVPSNLLMHRIGAKATISRIMLAWGVISACFMFVHTTTQFYALRFLLGAAEAGFFPGMILYLTYWFPSYRRAKMVALFHASIPISGIISGPLSGWIMNSLNGVHGLTNWQWLFVIESIPSLVLGVAVIFYLDDGVQHVRWLTPEEKGIIVHVIAEDNKNKFGQAAGSLRKVFSDPRMLLLIALGFCQAMGQYSISFWLPTLIKQSGVSNSLHIGLLSTIPFITAICCQVIVSRSSDKRLERRWHLIIPFCCGGIGVIVSALFSTNTALAMCALTFATAGCLTVSALFWNLPAAFMVGVGAAAGIALVNCCTNLAGFVSPYIFGLVKDATQSTNNAMYVLGGVLFIGAILTYTIPAKIVNR